MKKKPSLQTVDRALKLIDIMAYSSNQMSVVEISKALDITHTSVYTLLNSLMDSNFVEKDEATGKYHLGYKLLELGSIYRYQFPFVIAAERAIYMLSRKWKHQINLTIYKRPCLSVILLKKSPVDAQRSTQRVILPSYTTAGGKLLMAKLPERILQEDLKQIELKKYAKNTITEMDTLLEELSSIRAQGYAVEREENYNQKGCIAAPIYDISGEVIATVSMALQVEELEKDFSQCLDDILNTGNDISHEIGYNPYLR